MRLYAVSIDSHADTIEFAKKIAADGKGNINYPLLSDPQHKTIDAYGIRNPSFDDKAYDGKSFAGVPYPAVFVIDKQGRVAWAVIEEDYKKRPSNADIRAALSALK